MSSILSFTDQIPQAVTGEIIVSAGTTVPSGYLLCDGSIVSQSTYPALYSVLGLYPSGINSWYTFDTLQGLNIGYSLGYGNGIYVAVETSALFTSTDAITWSARTSGTTSSIYGISYGAATYAYAGAGGVLATSTDAITWVARTSGTTSAINALIYSGSLFVYAGAGGVLATSTDAITWTARTSGTISDITALIYSGSLFAYAGVGGALATSTDAITWTSRTSGTTSNILSLTYGNGLYVYGAVTGILATSADAITWTVQQINNTITIQSLTYGAGLYIYGDSSGYIGTSTNGTNWTNPKSISFGAGNIYALIYANGKFVANNSGSVIFSTSAYNYNTATSFSLPIIQNAPQGFSVSIKT